MKDPDFAVSLSQAAMEKVRKWDTEAHLSATVGVVESIMRYKKWKKYVLEDHTHHHLHVEPRRF